MTNVFYRKGCSVKVPSRTSISVINMNNFGPGRAGGGNLGFAIDYFTEIELKVSLKDEIEFLPQIPDFKKDELKIYCNYILDVWREKGSIYNEYKYSIRFITLTEPHIGVASFSSTFLSIIYGLNWLSGCNFNDNQIRDIVISKYKEVVNYKLIDGFTTGLSSFLNMYGGFGIIDKIMNNTTIIKTPKWKVFLVKPMHLDTISFGEKELQTLMGNGKEYDKLDYDEKMGLINLLLKSLNEKNLINVGKQIRELQLVGSKKAKINIYGNLIKNIIQNLYEMDFECCFLSAVGPGIVIITEDKNGNAFEVLKKLNLELIHTGEVDNKGIQIKTL